MKKLLSTLVLAVATVGIAAPASAQWIGGIDNDTLLGGAIGAGLGGVIGSNLAGGGVQDEGTALGAVIGGLAGASLANRNSNYYGNPYAGTYNPGFSGNNLIGTGTGAVLGGVIGSNLAASGVREEGTALGAVLGGVAGYALSNRGSSQQYGSYNGYPTYGYPTQTSGYSYGYAQPSYTYSQPRYTYSQPSYSYAQPTYSYGSTYSAPQYVSSSQYSSYSYTAQPQVYHQPTVTTTYVQPTNIRTVPSYHHTTQSNCGASNGGQIYCRPYR